MKKLLLLTLFISTQVLSQNQDFFLFNWSSDSLARINAHGLLNFQAEALNSSIAGVFVYGGEIDQEMKDKNLDAHRALNKMEANGFMQFNYQGKLREIGKLGFSWGIQLEQDISAYATYTKDFFELAFYGNSNLEEADLSNSSFTIWNIQKIGVPIAINLSDSTKNKVTEISIQPTLYVGRDYFQVNTNNFFMRTANNGSSITFEGEADIIISDTSDVYNSGIGGGINFHIYQKINRWEARLSGRNLGLVNWKQSLNASFSESRTYNGVPVTDIFNVSDSADAQGYIQDSIINWSEKNTTQWLPGTFEVSVRYRVLEKNYIIGSMRYINTRNFTPQTEVGFAHQGDVFQFGAAAGYGGMTRYLLGGYVGVNLLNFSTQLYSHSFLGGIGYDIPGLAANVGLRIQYSY